MTAEELRKKAVQMETQAQVLLNTSGHDSRNVEGFRLYLLMGILLECAAQLADLNGHLKEAGSLNDATLDVRLVDRFGEAK